jgi:hypothetical protein
VVDIEPDLWGYIQQASSSDSGASVPAAVANTGDADVAGLPNNADGFAQAFIKLRDKYAPNVLLGYELSMWGTMTDPLAQNIPLSQIDGLAARSTAFQQSLGAAFNLVFTDPADRDAGFDQYINGDGGNSWWDTTDYDRFNQYVGDFVRGVGLRMVLWQIPLGNTKMRAMNNVWGHYQDNHVEWWFDDSTATHLAATVNAGVVAMLFGGGADGTTSAFDTVGDGVTNPAPINGNTLTSYSADDDGGYFRHQVNAYYAAGAVAFPGSAYSTSATVGSQLLLLGMNQTIATSLMATANASVLVDVELYGPSGSPVASWTHDNVALTAGAAQTFTDVWSPGAGASVGAYTVMVGVEPAGGGTQLDWNSAAATFNVRAGGTYVAVDPKRLLDTRIGLGLTGRLVSSTPRTFLVADGNPVPPNAIAVTGNLTVTGQSSGGYVTLGPTVGASPTFSTINFPVGDNRANGVTVSLGAGGTLQAVFVGASSTASTQLVFDVTGYFAPDLDHAAYHALAPYRALDTRNGTGLSGVFVAGSPRTFSVGSSVPVTAEAVTGNLTTTTQSSRGFVTIGPAVLSTPAFSTLNFPVGDNRANNVTVKLGANGTLQAVYVATAGARTNLVFDVTGYYLAGAGGAVYVAISPVRLVDTRIGSGLSGPLRSGSIATISLTSAVPAGTVAVSGTATVTRQTSRGFVAVGPDLTWSATTSTVNFPVGDNRANGVVVPISEAGQLKVVFAGASTAATTHFIFDLTGFFVPKA